MNWIPDRLQTFGDEIAFIDRYGTVTYRQFLEKVNHWLNRFRTLKIKPGQVVALVGDCSPESAALLVALMLNGNTALPLATETRHQHSKWLQLSGAAAVIKIASNGKLWNGSIFDAVETHALIDELGTTGAAGLILFTSGTSGESKGTVLSAPALLERFRTLDAGQLKPRRSLVFLKLDHIGGINTLFSILFNGGTA
ncbi:MAG: AMP-binding protein, partial [Exilibacterium sp.]